MTQKLTVEVSEQVFVAMQQQANALGVSPEQLAATLLQRQFTQAFSSPLNETEKEAARSRFERHFGTLTVDQSDSPDNETIDADLAAEYASIAGFDYRSPF